MDVSFSNLTFKGYSAGLSLMINGKPSKVVADHIVVSAGTTSFLKGELEVKQSFEFGPLSSISAEKIITNKPKLIMNYRLGENFGTIPDSIEPESIVLNYIGESNGDGIPDYDAYLGSINDVKTFAGENRLSKCNEWKGKTTLESLKYPEFKGKNSVVQVLCIDKSTLSTLSVNVTVIPSGVVEDPGNSGNAGTNKDKDSSKKKFPIGAIIGIVVGSMAVIVVVSVLIWFFVSKKKKVNAVSNDDSP